MNLDNLENFLITHSKINKKFIEDFFGFQKRTELKEHDPFIIDLEDVCFWLEGRKDHLKDTLIDSYTKEFDFVIIPPFREKYLGKSKRDILCQNVPFCAWLFTMKLMFYYKNFMINRVLRK
jgi:hypothetical protein